MKRQQTNKKRKIYNKKTIDQRKMAKILANFKCSPRHEEVKEAGRICKESRARKLNFGAGNEVPQFCSKISVFKKAFDSGTY